jgi:hypothetical protein
MTTPKKPQIIRVDDPNSEYCNCAETIVGNVQVKKPRYHSCAYIGRLYGYIGEACVQADALAARNKQDNARWSAAFGRIMDRYRRKVLSEMELEERAQRAEQIRLEAAASAVRAEEEARAAEAALSEAVPPVRVKAKKKKKIIPQEPPAIA